MVSASFRFYDALNDFLAPERRGREFTAVCARAATTKHMIEALGVPHTEVELVLVNGESVGFGRILRDGDRVSVYPKFEALDVTPLLRVSDRSLREFRFVADAHLGGLARLLRMAGFDTLYDNGFDDGEIEAIAGRERRIVLTRDRELLKRRTIVDGCYVRALKAQDQLRELVERLDLRRRFRPFRLCLHCNVPLRPIDKARIVDRLPPTVRERQWRFSTCDQCRRVYWEGTHWQRMRAMLDRTTVASPNPLHEETSMAEQWLSSLQTTGPQEGYELAIKLSRMGVKYTQQSAEVRDRLRPEYAENADSLTAVSQVVAINFQTIAAANNYWRS